MKEKIRIASGQGFWGDLPNAPIDQVNKGEIDYLVLDYLAEVTMSILQSQKLKNSKRGFAYDFVDLVKIILPTIKNKNIKIITNAGGANVFECANEIKKIAIENKLSLKIGIVSGDDIFPQINEFVNQKIEFENIDTGENISKVLNNLSSANVYLGAKPIVELLKCGAEIIITGRVTDAGLTLAPIMYEFNYKEDEFDKLASGIVAGHILECGAQSSGGNCSLNWEDIPDLANIGFPIVEFYKDGSFLVTKHENTGGKISVATVTEQLVYEIGDPKNYITPDCITDFTSIKIEQIKKDCVKISEVKGLKPTDFYKISMTYKDGFRTFGTLTYSWPDALKKAKRADLIIRERTNNLNLNEIYSEFIGNNSTLGKMADNKEDYDEIMLRIGVHSSNEKSVNDFGKQIAPLVLTGPPGVTGYLGNRPKAMEVLSYWPCLIPKNLVKPRTELIEVK